MDKWFYASMDELMAVGLTAVFMYAALIMYTRASGLRSFSKMAGFDFATTVAFGSVLASVILTKDPSLLLGAYAMGVLFVLQKLLGVLRKQFKGVEKLLGNTPMMLMYEGQFFEKNMARVQVTHSDIIAKMREANVIAMEQVRAVVFEATGDVSVLHSDNKQDEVEAFLLEDVDWGDQTAPFRG